MFPLDTKILIVDDLKTIRHILGEILTGFGFAQINDVGDGQTAFSMLKEAHSNNEPYGLIFCDWNMPGFTGLDLLNAKNEDSQIKSTPFIMVTIENEKAYVLKAIAMGVDDFVVKPFTEKVIKTKMQAVWSKLTQ